VRSLRRTVAVSAALAALVSTAALSGSPATAGPAAGKGTYVATTAPVPPLAPGSIRIVQANLLSGQAVGKFQADVATVLGQTPDFITYNEVPERNDAVLTGAYPTGSTTYQLWRTPGQYTGATPVAWNTARWTMVNQGTTMVSDAVGRDPGKNVDLGVRYANWVTLQGVDGHMISVISAHLAPDGTYSRGLIPISLDRLNALAGQLGASGPVLIAGDFNVHYAGAEYPRDQLTAMGWTPSYDALGFYMPTGDHYGATIDYVFMRSVQQFIVQNQYSTELNSDHDAVTVDLALTGAPVDLPVTFAPGSVTNVPNGKKDQKRAVLDLLARAIDNTPKGGVVHLATEKLSDQTVTKSLKKAIRRGVKVQFVTYNKKVTGQERILMNRLGDRTKRKSWAVGCTGLCVNMVKKKKVSGTMLLISQSGATLGLRIDTDQDVTYVNGAKKASTAKINTSKQKYDEAFKQFFRLVGRKL
jgi:endonuclease/exonuclease/phosphatase family metal-dependent hydrolase